MATINVKPAGTPGAYSAYGGCLEFMQSKDPQVIIYGGTGTGKTTAGCWKMLLLCLKYPGCKFLFTRSSYTALVTSGVATFERVIAESGMSIGKKPGQIRRLGESKPTEYRFPYAKRMGVDADGVTPRLYEGNSTIILASLDNAKDKLGFECDFIYVNQPEQSSEEDWVYVCSRADGRYGHAPFNQIYGDPNPEHPQHWIKRGGWELGEGQTSEDGKWRLIKSTYRDNPVMWDMVKQCLTPVGEKRVANAYQSMNPVMQKRLIESEWASYEGLVYADNWDRKKHIISTYELEKQYTIDETWKRYWAIDWGFDDPFVCSMFAKHPTKELYIRYKLIYMSNKTIPEHAETIRRNTIGEPLPTLIVADRGPQEIALLSQCLNLNIISAKKGPGSVKARINIITDMLKNNELLFLDDALVEEDKRLLMLKRPIGFEQEVENIRWRNNTRLVDDTPIDGDDHEENCLGYLMCALKADQRKIKAVWI